MILQVVQTRGRCSVQQVVEALPGPIKYTTVMTVMSRLAVKGELRRERVGRHFEYWADRTILKRAEGIVKRLINKIFQGKPSALVQYLINSDSVSPKELETIATLIQEAREQSK